MTIDATTKLEVLTCCDCGNTLAMSKRWVEKAKAVGGFKQQFWCPYCCTRQGWGESAHEKKIRCLEAERDRMKRAADYQRTAKERAQADAKHLRRSRNGMKGALVKMKKKAE